MNKVYRAAIDIGTVTTRLLIARVEDGAQPLVEKLYKKSVITNLGLGVDATGLLSPDAIQRTVACLQDYQNTIATYAQEHGNIPVRVVATSASRDARNAHEFIQEAEKLGLVIDVISGDDEAYLSFLGTSYSFLGKEILIADIGGGSTELVHGSTILSDGKLDVRIQKAKSFDIGGRRVNERTLHHDPPSQTELHEASSWIHSEVSSFLEDVTSDVVFVPIAGTPTSIVAVRDCLVPYDSNHVHKAKVSRADVESVYERIVSLPLSQREHV
ncbi:MAG: Ppx/GppA family phosphatase, partial [Eggerthellaceae bacterium]|nr:Ppx/GppA family phosphatase [Eggerthellaceae bacterium]